MVNLHKVFQNILTLYFVDFVELFDVSIVHSFFDADIVYVSMWQEITVVGIHHNVVGI